MGSKSDARREAEVSKSDAREAEVLEERRTLKPRPLQSYIREAEVLEERRTKESKPPDRAD